MSEPFIKIFFVLDYIIQQYLLILSNTGCGSTTVANSFIHFKDPKSEKFESGVCIGYPTGIPGLQIIPLRDRVNIVDVPGLGSVHSGKAAAKALANALQSDGDFKIIFVIKLAKGGLRSYDMQVIKRVLDYYTSGITDYGVVVNQLSKKMVETVSISTLQEKIKFETKSYANPHLILLPRYDEIEDQPNAVIDCPELFEFIESLPYNKLQSKKVDPISFSYGDKEHVESLQRQLSAQQGTNAQLNKNIEQYERYLKYK